MAAGVVPAPTRASRTRSVVMLGASSAPVCGVRDYSRLLGAALANRGVHTVDVWWEIDPEAGLGQRRRDVSNWLHRLSEATAGAPGAVVVFQYSVFTYGYRGVPTLVPRIASCLARIEAPRVGVLHEFAYPFGRRGLRGTVQAASQRAAFARLYRVLDAAVVTTEERRDWLEARAWLPRRPTVFVPVCSNIPDVETPGGPRSGEAAAVGVFGFASEGYALESVLGAIGRLHRQGIRATLTLIGAPGPRSHQAGRWRAAAAAAGCLDALSFTGVLEPEAVARALHDVDVLVLPDRNGPSGRKGTLAAALAAARPVVAFDGPQRWEALVRERAVAVVAPEADQVADLLEHLLHDPRARAAQGSRGRAFYASHQAPAVIAEKLLEFLESIRAGAAT